MTSTGMSLLIATFLINGAESLKLDFDITPPWINSDFQLPSPVIKPSVAVGEHDWLIKHPTILQLLTLQNAERARHGLAPLQLNTQMCIAAHRHAVWMGDTGYYQHSGLPYREIIFRGPLTPDAAVNGWIASPAHHGIMLSGSEVGLGYAIRNGQTYWVGVFR